MPLSELRLDRTGFYDLVIGFPGQIRIAREIAEAVDLGRLQDRAFKNVVLAGMGGSAAGGDFLKALFTLESTVPFTVSKDYDVPNWVGGDTLAFITSYSGNTEETLSAYDQAVSRGASCFIVSGGGKLVSEAVTHGHPSAVVPGGQPPRTALGYMLTPLVVVASKLGLIHETSWHDVDKALASVKSECAIEIETSKNPAKKLAENLKGKVPAVYGQGPLTDAVGNRWRGQINENSKAMCLTHAFPELCHNEILGWEGSQSQGNWSVVVLKGNGESPRMAKRVAETLDLIGQSPTVVEAKGETALAKMLSLAYFGDFVSLYLAELMGQDPAQMKAIDTLKARLS